MVGGTVLVHISCLVSSRFAAQGIPSDALPTTKMSRYFLSFGCRVPFRSVLSRSVVRFHAIISFHRSTGQLQYTTIAIGNVHAVFRSSLIYLKSVLSSSNAVADPTPQSTKPSSLHKFPVQPAWFISFRKPRAF